MGAQGPGGGYAPPGGGFGTPVRGGPMPRFQLNQSNMTTLDWVTAGASLLLFIFLFLPWYDAHAQGISVSGSALDHGYMYLSLILCLALIGYYVAKLGWGRLPFQLPFPEAMLVLGISGVNLLLVIIAFFDKVVCAFGVCGSGDGIGWTFGSILGLIAALAAVGGVGYPLVNQRQRAGLR
jgi:hypothetical protein